MTVAIAIAPPWRRGRKFFCCLSGSTRLARQRSQKIRCFDFRAVAVCQIARFQRFVDACHTFCSADRLFSTRCELFYEKQGGRGVCRQKIHPPRAPAVDISCPVVPSEPSNVRLPMPRRHRKYGVLGRRHRYVALAVAPKDGIQHFVIRLVRMAPVHRGRCFRARRSRGIALED
jgi:hypothetical protein